MASINWQDLAERAGWTAAQAVLGVVGTELAGVQVWWAVPIATALSAAKTWVAGRVKTSG